MGLMSVPIQEAISQADSLEVYYYSPTGVMLPASETMEGKRLTSMKLLNERLHNNALKYHLFFFRWVGPSPDELAVADELVEGLTHNTLE